MYAYQITIDDYLNIVELAKKNGKKIGDSMEEEFKEYFKNKKLKYIGEFDSKISLQGYFIANGKKVLDLTKEKNNE